AGHGAQSGRRRRVSARVQAGHKPTHCPRTGPVTLLGSLPPTGAGRLPVHDSGPRTVFAATTTSWPAVLSLTVTGPAMSLATTATRRVVRAMRTGPRTWVPVIARRSAPSARTGPRTCESVTTRPAPAATVTGPRRSASVTQVVPSATRSGPRRSPVTVTSHSGTGTAGVSAWTFTDPAK